MTILNGVISGFLAFGLFGFLSMMGIFSGGAGAQAGQLALANIVGWGGVSLGLSGLLLNIWGQLKYHKLQEGDPTLVPLLMMYSCIPFAVIFFTFCFLFVFKD